MAASTAKIYFQETSIIQSMNKIRQTDQIIVILNPIDFFRSIVPVHIRCEVLASCNAPSDFIVQVVYFRFTEQLQFFCGIHRGY